MEGPKVVAPPLQPTLMLLFLYFGQWLILQVKTNFFIQAFFETPLKIATIDIFLLKFKHFSNSPKMGKFRDFEKDLDRISKIALMKKFVFI